MALLDTKEVLKEIEENHNWSLFEEIVERNKNNLTKTALFYRGKNISYNEMIENMKKYAGALRTRGITKGSEVPAVMADTPELVYLVGACSIIGAKINLFSDEFDKNYIDEIISSCDSPAIVVSDNYYEEIKENIRKSGKRVIMTSLNESLPKNENLFQEFDGKFCDFSNRIDFFKSQNENDIISMNELIKKDNVHDYHVERSGLDDELTITYSSGSTNSSHPKAIIHANRTYITMGRFHDPEVSGTPSMKNLRILSHIPSHSNTNLMSCITDVLIQGATVCLEPIYNKDFFLYSLLINKPSFPCATRSFWVHLSKQIMNLKKEYNIDIKFPFLLAPMSVGEPLSRGEEKLINKMLKMTKAGTEFTHTPMSVISISIAGGDCEHGGIFFQMFRTLTNKLNSLPSNEYDPMRTYSMVNVIAINNNGEICKDGEYGRLYASSPCNMKGYKNNPEANKKFFKEINGVIYGDCSTYGYIGKKKFVHVKGRILEEMNHTPEFIIADQISLDTKNILSCEVVRDISGKYVAHIELQPYNTKDIKRIIISAQERCKKITNEDIYFRLHSNQESFIQTGCGKRNGNILRDEGISKAFKIDESTKNIIPCEKEIKIDIENNKVLIKAKQAIN